MTPDAPPDFALPKRLGRYVLFDAIGRGGMADIFLARAETQLGATQRVVVKRILPRYADDPTFSEMLVHEAKLAARLEHANVVRVFDLGREADALYIAMEYVEGYDLNQLLRRCSDAKVALPVEYALFVVSEVLRGLDYAHRKRGEDGEPLGVVHRDVSPSNVLVSFDGEVKLCDFGIAHANDAVPGATTEAYDEALRGKAGYMSPEHARGEALDARADVFAAAVLGWEMLAGRRLYRVRGDEAPLLEQARAAVIPELPKRGLPDEAELHRILTKGLARDRADRFASAGAMLRELEAWIVRARLVASPLKLGAFLGEQLGDERVRERSARERELPPAASPGAHVAVADLALPRPTPPPPAVATAEPTPDPTRAPSPEPAEVVEATEADVPPPPSSRDAVDVDTEAEPEAAAPPTSPSRRPPWPLPQSLGVVRAFREGRLADVPPPPESSGHALVTLDGRPASSRPPRGPLAVVPPFAWVVLALVLVVVAVALAGGR